jgi:hypothetical protein
MKIASSGVLGWLQFASNMFCEGSHFISYVDFKRSIIITVFTNSKPSDFGCVC